MESLFQPLSDATGASVDQIKLIACIIASYPLGSVFVRIPQTKPAVRHAFSIVVSTIYLIPILNLGLGMAQLLCSVLATYVLAATLHGKFMPWAVFAVVMSHLTVNHVYRALHEVPYETFEITLPQMTLVMKLTMFAWNVYDGRRPTEELDNWQLKNRVVKMPSLLAFLGYTFYFPSILVGPSTQYAIYASLIDGSLFERAEGPVHNGHNGHNGHTKYVPSGRKRVGYARMLTGFVWMAIFVLSSGKFNYDSILTEAWLKKGLLDKFVTVQIIGIVTRARYYSVWLLAEGACILTGLGFSGYTASGGTQWNEAANVNIPVIELAPNFKLLIDSWNMKTNVWLRETVYKRIASKGKKPGFKSSMCTFVTSAIWHGVASGYYLSFVLGGFVSAAARWCRANLRPLFLSPVLPETDKLKKQSPPPTFAKAAYDVLSCFVTIILTNFLVAPFIIGSFSESIEAWRRLYWYGLWITGGTLVVSMFGGKAMARRLQTKRIREAQTKHGNLMNNERVSYPNGNRTANGPDPLVLPPVDAAVAEVEKKLR